MCCVRAVRHMEATVTVTSNVNQLGRYILNEDVSHMLETDATTAFSRLQAFDNTALIFWI